jgi:hypothetical protein
MVNVSFLTLAERDAIELAARLHDEHLLMFDTIEEHVDLLWEEGGPTRRTLTHLSGSTKALLYAKVEKLATELLGDRLVRMWAQPVTSFDQRSTKALMEGLAPA